MGEVAGNEAMGLTGAAAIAASPEEQHPQKAFGWAARDPSGVLSPFSFSRRATGDDDVKMKILYCGICHSDLHSLKNEWQNTIYPIVPGHEIAGVVTEVGRNVQNFKVGDKVGVGCLVDSCRTCDSCKQGFENYCPKWVLTYNSTHSDGTVTYGGYSDTMVVNKEFVDFAGKHNITAEIEVISFDYLNKAMERLAKNDVKYRFVIDVANSSGAA